MAPTLSKSARDKLGERLRKAATPDPADVAVLLALQVEYESAVRSVVARLHHHFGTPPVYEATLTMTHRVKTMNTLIEKLRRSKTRLSTVQDLAGVRIVAPHAGKAYQDALVAEVARAFEPEVYRIDDLRLTPSCGYRAVHVLVELDGFRVEIQVRTRWQHFWANATERIADQWGRDIRYGGSPTAATDVERAARASAFQRWLGVADALVTLEEEQAALMADYLAEVVKILSTEKIGVEEAGLRVLGAPEMAARVDALVDAVYREVEAAGDEISQLVRNKPLRELR